MPNPYYWTNTIEEDEDSREEFQSLYNNENILEAYYYIPEVLLDTYLNMEVVLPCGGEGPEFYKGTKWLCDKNGIPIGTSNEKPILETIVYEVEYMNGHRA